MQFVFCETKKIKILFKMLAGLYLATSCTTFAMHSANYAFYYYYFGNLEMESCVLVSTCVSFIYYYFDVFLLY